MSYHPSIQKTDKKLDGKANIMNEVLRPAVYPEVAIRRTAFTPVVVRLPEGDYTLLLAAYKGFYSVGTTISTGGSVLMGIVPDSAPEARSNSYSLSRRVGCSPLRAARTLGVACRGRITGFLGACDSFPKKGLDFSTYPSDECKDHQNRKGKTVEKGDSA